MPLNTQITRDGKVRKVRWGGFHVAAMVFVAALDSESGGLYEHMVEKSKETGEELPKPDEQISISPADVWTLMDYGVIAMTPLNSGSYTAKRTWTFIDPSDGEVFVIKPGDVLSAWRGH